jgi:membrane protein implicated in regulation of membrane protease activity
MGARAGIELDELGSLGGDLLEGLDIVVWAVVGALALVGELLTVSFFLLFFSVGALVALLMAFLGLGIAFQVGGFVVAVALSMTVFRPTLLHRTSFRESEKYEPRAGITGKTGVVTSVIEPGGSGTVRIGSGEFWTARSLYPGQRLEPGVRVRVLDTDGLTALVETLEIEEGGKR